LETGGSRLSLNEKGFMTIKSNDQFALEFLQHPDQPFTTTFDGKPCDAAKAQRVLKEGKMVENGIVMDDGNEYWFSGTLDGKAFVFSILGEGVGGKIGRKSYEQFSVSPSVEEKGTKHNG
jgi:hypothetical protein